MKTGFNILREICWWKGIVRQSLVCMTLKMAPNTSRICRRKMRADLYIEGNPRIAKVTAKGLRKSLPATRNASAWTASLIKTWFNNLNWGPDKVAAERVQILKTGNMGFTTEVSGCWSCIH